MKPVITKVLDISIRHITSQDVTLLQQHEWRRNAEDRMPYHIVPTADAYSWWVWVGDLYGGAGAVEERVGEAEDEGFSSYFTYIIRLAHKFECAFIRFDSDGAVYEDLPTVDW